MVKIDFNEEKHEYTVNGVKVPSVSEVISPLSSDRFREINPNILAQAAERGKYIHAITEGIDYGIDPSEEEMMEWEGYIGAYYKFLLDHEVDWELIEQIVWMPWFIPDGFPDENNVVYAGTVDRFGLVDGEPAIVDIKTYSSLTTDSMMTASCQTQLYKDAVFWTLDEQTEGAYESIKRYVLHLKGDGKYRLASLDKFDTERGWASGAVARELTQLWWRKQACYNTGRNRKK